MIQGESLNICLIKILSCLGWRQDRIKPESLIGQILSHHNEENSNEIIVGPDVVIKPQLNYNGLVARKAFVKGFKYLNKGRTHAGLLDFKIFYLSKPVVHTPDVIKPALNLPLSAIREIYHGCDPLSLNDLSDEQNGIACCLQSAFVEQEINWGEEIFQQRTYFGRQDMKELILRNAVPRDFLMVYLERCKHVMVTDELDINLAIESEVEHVISQKGSMVVKLPLTDDRPGWKKKVLPKFKPHIPSEVFTQFSHKWITPFIQQALKQCTIKGKSKYYPNYE